MVITGTKSYVQIEDDEGNIARFSGETCLGGFYAYAENVSWIRHTGEAADEDRIDLIYKATQYGKNNDIEVLFFESNGKVMFETELRLKTEVYLCKTYFVFMAAVVLPLFFSVLFIVILGVASPAFNAALSIGAALAAAPFLIYGVLVWRFRIVAEGEFVTVRPGFGRRYGFHVDEITRIVRKTKMDMGWEEVKKIKIYAKHKHVSLNRSMIGIDEMDAFLMRHVAPMKFINTCEKS